MTRIYVLYSISHVFLFRSAPSQRQNEQYWLPATPFLSLFKSTRDAEPTVGVSKIKRHTIRSAGTVITWRSSVLIARTQTTPARPARRRRWPTSRRDAQSCRGSPLQMAATARTSLFHGLEESTRVAMSRRERGREPPCTDPPA